MKFYGEEFADRIFISSECNEEKCNIMFYVENKVFNKEYVERVINEFINIVNNLEQLIFESIKNRINEYMNIIASSLRQGQIYK